MSLTFTTIGALVSGLPKKYGNRLDLNNTADGSTPITAMRQAIDELTETYEFEELKYQTPTPPLAPLTLTPSNPIVPIPSLIATISTNSANYPQFQNQNFVDLTDVYTFWIWFSGGVNQAGRTLKYRRVTTIDQDSYGITSATQGTIGIAPPVYFTRFGSLLQVGPSPDNSYQFFVRMKLRHPFPITEPFNTAILTPTIAAGAITSVAVTSAGSGYQASSTIPLLFSTPVNGAAATGTASTNSSGGVQSVTVSTGGSGYTSTNATVFTAAIGGQKVFVPSSWHEIIQYACCWRIATNTGESEYINYFDNILKSKGVDIQEARAAKSQMKRDERHNERGLMLQLGGKYTFA